MGATKQRSRFRFPRLKGGAMVGRGGAFSRGSVMGIAVVLVAAGATAFGATTAVAVRAHPKEPSKVAGAVPTVSAWKVISSPNPGADGPYVQREFREVTAASATQVWAAGYANGPLIASWDGASWTVDSLPVPGGGNGTLNAIDTDGNGDVWAVGNQSSTPYQWALRLIGGVWTNVAVTGAPTLADLRDVSVVSASNVWAVGDDAGGVAAVAMHWNGSTWASIPPPVPAGASGVQLNRVELIRGTTKVIAVGYYVKSSQFYPYSARWTGSAWKVVPTPTNPPGELVGVVAESSTNAWAVGDRNPTSNTPKSLIEHWDGTRWSAVASPNRAGANFLMSVDASTSAPTDVWAVGYTYPSERTLAMHYNGTGWSLATTPNPATAAGDVDQFFGTSYVPGTNMCWAVGTNGPARPAGTGEYTLTERCTC